MKRLPTFPPGRPDRPASALLHDEDSVRIVGFTLLAGQVVPPHTSASTVFVQVVAGGARFDGADTNLTLAPGEGAVYEPGELHAIHAGEAGVRFLAIIAPAPR